MSEITCPSCGEKFYLKDVSERMVLSVIEKHSKLRWSSILDEVHLSSRTVSSALKRLIKKGLVFREQGTGTYPPPVYYGRVDTKHGQKKGE